MEPPKAISAPEEQRARPAGIEPATHGLEGRCSIQLSYGCIQVGVTGFEPATYGSQNRRATRLRYTPRSGRLTHRRTIAQATLWFHDLCGPLARLCSARGVSRGRAERLLDFVLRHVFRLLKCDRLSQSADYVWPFAMICHLCYVLCFNMTEDTNPSLNICLMWPPRCC